MSPAILVLAEGSSGLLPVIVGLVGLAVGVIGGVMINRIMAARSIDAARNQANEIIERAQREARTEAEKLKLEAERIAFERKEKFDAKVEASHAEFRETERRLGKREDVLHSKDEALLAREKALAKRDEKLQARDTKIQKREQDVEKIIQEQTQKLHQLANLSKEQALETLLQRVEEDNRHEVAKVVRQVVDEAEEGAQDKATELAPMATQPIAPEVTSESTVRTVAIPSDDMKGRIIGREGRNIRAIERVTGVDIIVDDTPGVIVVSCFDKVRQAVAVEALDRLIADGRMHPTRIEEVVEKVQNEIGERITKNGKEPVPEVNIRRLHPKIKAHKGKLH